jgi:cyclohexanone monooxygenase
MNDTDQIRELDVLVVGTGFGGIYMLHKLHNDLGLDAVAIDKAAGVGGTWYWNKYPGALSDSESLVYQYSFDRELYEQTPWTTKFARQPAQRRYRPGERSRLRRWRPVRNETSGPTGALRDCPAGLRRTH